MQFLVISDSHGRSDLLRAALDRTPDCKNVLFLGDGLADVAAVAPSFPDRSFRCVRGNMDAPSLDLPAEEIDFFALYGNTVMMTHGHRFGVKGGIGTAVAYAGRRGARVLLFGHTHVPEDRFLPEEGMFVCNPGSLGRPADGVPHFGVLSLLPDGGALFSHGTLSPEKFL